MTEVVVLSRQDCLPCRRVKRLLGDLVRERPEVTVREVDLGSPEGIRLAMAHGVAYPPAVFIDGRLHAFGKVNEGPLRAAMAHAQGA